MIYHYVASPSFQSSEGRRIDETILIMRTVEKIIGALF